MRAAAFLSRSLHGVYYARFVVPLQRLTPGNSREFRLSTGTKDPRAARALARHLRVCFEQYLIDNATYQRTHAIEYLRAHMPKRPDQPMGFGIKRTKDGYELTDLTPADAKALTAGDMDDLLASLESRWNTAQPAPIAEHPTPGKEPNPAPRPGAGAGDESGAQGQGPAPKTAPRRSRLRVEKLAKEFMEYEASRAKNGELASKEMNKIRTRLKPFVEYFDGREINDLTAFDMEQFARAMAYYPTFLDDISEAKGLKFREIIEKSKAGTLMKNDGEPALTITKNTHLGYMQIPKNFITYCTKRNLGSKTLVEGLSAPVPNLREGTKRRAFLKEELQQIFNSAYYREARYNTSYQYWVPLIAAFTGARVNEIAQLQPGDVKQDDEGLWYFDITDDDDSKKTLKTAQSKRIIPLHQVLLNLKLVEYVKSKQAEGAANLFDITPERADRHGRAPARWFNAEYLRDYLHIEDPAVSFHSFRHRFITSMHQAIFDASDVKGELIASTTPALILRRMVGHSDMSLMTAGRSKDVHTDTYTGALSVKSMKKVIDLLQYPGVRFWEYIEPTEGKRQRMKGPDAFEISGDDLANIL